jgi:hypothetical protein
MELAHEICGIKHVNRMGNVALVFISLGITLALKVRDPQRVELPSDAGFGSYVIPWSDHQAFWRQPPAKIRLAADVIQQCQRRDISGHDVNDGLWVCSALVDRRDTSVLRFVILHCRDPEGDGAVRRDLLQICLRDRDSGQRLFDTLNIGIVMPLHHLRLPH